jgi:hypothetical protein
MSLLLHIIANLILFVVLGVVVLTLLTWLTRTRSGHIRPPSSGEWPEDKATHMNRISAPRPVSRQDPKEEQKRRRA